MNLSLVSPKSNQNHNQLQTFLFLFTLIDIFFLPYLNSITIPYSLPFVLIWFLFKYFNLKNFNTLLSLNFLILFMITSFVYGFLLDSVYAYENFVSLIRIFYYIALVILFNQFTFKKSLFFDWIFNLFYFFVFILALFYLNDKLNYLQIRNFWNFRASFFVDEFYIGNDVLSNFRFSHIYMDPNNIGYLMSFIFFLTNFHIYKSKSFFTFILSISATLIVLIAAQSSGSIIGFLLTFYLYLFFYVFKITKSGLSLIIFKLFLVFLALLVSILLLNQFIDTLLDVNFINSALDRFNSNSGDSRFDIWFFTLNNTKFYEYITYIFIGRGGTTIINGTPLATHNGPLFIIYAYGLIFFTMIIIILRNYLKKIKIKDMLFLIPILIGFLINILIGEYKLIAIVLFLLVYFKSTYSNELITQ